MRRFSFTSDNAEKQSNKSKLIKNRLRFISGAYSIALLCMRWRMSLRQGLATELFSIDPEN